jgi:hypothetical protein
MRWNFRSKKLLAGDRELSVGLPGGVALRLDPTALADSLLGLRAFQAFDATAMHFPIHRVLRFAARRPLDELFDDLAQLAATRSHRIDVGTLMLEGAGYIAVVEGRRKTDYASGSARVWARSKAELQEVERRVLGIVGDDRVHEEMFTIDWHFHSGHMGLSNVTFEEIADADLQDSAYPAIGGGVADFIARYLNARETVLILQGPPGTGKTRLVRAILAGISRRKKDSAKVLYTADKRTLENDELYVEFLTGEHDAFVVEDADHLLGARANGNADLHRFLTVADGVVRAQGRKIIFTTNLHNLGDIDEALVRPGRCFAVLRTTPLARSEVAQLLAAMAREQPKLSHARVQTAVLDALFAGGARVATLAAVYQALESV